MPVAYAMGAYSRANPFWSHYLQNVILAPPPSKKTLNLSFSHCLDFVTVTRTSLNLALRIGKEENHFAK